MLTVKKAQAPQKKKSMVAVVNAPEQTIKEEDDSEEDDGTGSKKINYRLPVTASELFRANFIVDKTLKKKKNVR